MFGPHGGEMKNRKRKTRKKPEKQVMCNHYIIEEIQEYYYRIKYYYLHECQ